MLTLTLVCQTQHEVSNQFKSLRQKINDLNRWIDRSLDAFSVYALPIGIGLVSLLAILTWRTEYAATEPQPLAIRVFKGSPDTDDPRLVLAQLQNASTTPFHDTQLSEAPFWLLFDIPQTASPTLTVEFPSRHTVEIACWKTATVSLLGRADRHAREGSISAVKAGFALTLEPATDARQVLCRTRAIGPARLSVIGWSSTDLQSSVKEFHRKSGLLDGGVIVLAVFILVTALINRNRLYVLFAAWLVVNLRMGSLSAGWDTQWLGQTIPYEWLLQGRMVTIALYYVLTLTLFTSLFKDDFLRIGHRGLVTLLQWTCFPLLALSLILPAGKFLPVFWPFVAMGGLSLAYLLVRIVRKTRSKVAMWYSAALSFTLVASLYEVLAAALGIKGLIGSINSVTAALSSSLLAALAIAQQMREEHEQRLAVQAELTHTFEAMPIGLFTLDMRGRFLSANPALLAMLGPKVLAKNGSHWQEYFSQGAWTALHERVHDQDQAELELSGRPEVDLSEAKRFLVKATLARDRIEGSLQDITEKAKAAEDLLFLARHDPLTKVLNRRGIERAFNEARTEREGRASPVALAYLDLDRFKLINDLFGHGVGDQVLQQVCARVSALLFRNHQFGRVGGDEFVIVFDETAITLSSVMCRGIIDVIGTRAFAVGENAFNVRASIGLIEVSAGMKFNDALSSADRACREAKAAQGGGMVIYERDAIAFKLHQAELKLIALLATDAATSGLLLQMQPIMSLVAPHESLNFEVLLRMRDSEGQAVRTDHLIAAGEASGRMSMIDRWVLSTTMTWLNAHHDEIKHTKFICMNLSGASLNDEKFLEEVYVMLESNPLIVRQLCLEITESVALHDLENTRRFVNKVRSYGAKVALDDFGAGYTSFSYLKEFKADLLKIDGSFIVNMNHHPANIAIVEAIVSLAKNLGMKVIAEWAEDLDTVQTLVEIGVDYVQGFAVARPQDPDKLLSAPSSASFIRDKEVARYVDEIGKSAGPVMEIELYPKAPTRKVH